MFFRRDYRRHPRGPGGDAALRRPLSQDLRELQSALHGRDGHREGDGEASALSGRKQCVNIYFLTIISLACCREQHFIGW